MGGIGISESAGINRLGIRNERVLQRIAGENNGEKETNTTQIKEGFAQEERCSRLHRPWAADSWLRNRQPRLARAGCRGGDVCWVCK